MVALERDNPRLKGALNKNYGRADLDKHRLGELIDLIGSIQLADVASHSKDLLGRVFEYFLTQFASAEGKNGGQFEESLRLEQAIKANMEKLGYGL
jgi:type I restriction enzyme M protein